MNMGNKLYCSVPVGARRENTGARRIGRAGARLGHCDGVTAGHEHRGAVAARDVRAEADAHAGRLRKGKVGGVGGEGGIGGNEGRGL